MASLLCALAVLTIVSGCGGGGSGSNIDYSGTYSGTASFTSGARGKIAMRVLSNGSAVAVLAISSSSSTITIPGTVNTSNGNINLTNSTTDGSERITITGKARRDDASGDIDVRAGSQRVSGTFKMSKISGGSSSLTAPNSEAPTSSEEFSDALKKGFKLD